jgi:(S)-2-hydroxyglutarate dehydrogenase
VDRYDVAVVGGGLIGLATALQLLEQRPGIGLVVLKKEPQLAMHQSGRNSGVIHAGLYYAPGSLKARLSREGMTLVRGFADEHGIPYGELRQTRDRAGRVGGRPARGAETARDRERAARAARARA